jgi:hypothetical protein
LPATKSVPNTSWVIAAAGMRPSTSVTKKVDNRSLMRRSASCNGNYSSGPVPGGVRGLRGKAVVPHMM